ncbi:putative chromosome condensation protein [Phaeomoniella chlamydospora]|uniref:Putative chromosome condensation protein n=1 Tax=Phaeomoniella chlamydospora TaxID=158046 RepID=A0A0G2F002_PHACM|nr:putative chromosome condensation protein [Phaeomoniella chlamydospora]
MTTRDLERRRSQPPIDGDDQEGYYLSEIAAAPPADPSDPQHGSLEKHVSATKSKRSSQRSGPLDREEDLTELAAGAPAIRRSDDEEALNRETNGYAPDQEGISKDQSEPNTPNQRSYFATELYIHCYLIFLSIWGVLARLGVEAITSYPGAPVITPVIWANFGGSFIFGFLSEDQRLFREEWGVPEKSTFSNAPSPTSLGDNALQKIDTSTLTSLKKKHTTVKKTIPLYIGLTTGFCGSFTSFSSFIRDAFLALSNDLYSPNDPKTSPVPSRHTGYSVTALLAIIILEIAISLSGLIFGAHIALSLDRFLPTLPFRLVRRIFDPLTVLLSLGCWLGALLLTIFPPTKVWRGRALFAILFAPPGCLLRFYLSKYLNSRLSSFPLGTFAANIIGTLMLGMCYDLQHISSIGGGLLHRSITCQVLEGVMEGFCGALTTVSTWVGELNGLRRRHAYIYGFGSVGIAIAGLVVIMGSVRWSRGFDLKIGCSI